MKLILVDKENYKEAIRVQNSIFPNENGTLNIIASLDIDLFVKTTGLEYKNDHVKYYLAEVDGRYVGITGMYYYDEYIDSAWLGWYGVLPEYRNKGYGREILRKTTDLAREKGFQNMRLYTDFVDNHNAINLYEEEGFVGEKYTLEKLSYDCWIYSKSLTEKEVELWNNKNLNLSYQSQLEHVNINQINDIISIYDEMGAR